MKKLFGIMGAIVSFVLVSMAIVACGSDEPEGGDDDDDDVEIPSTGDLWSGNLGSPEYESDAALYEVAGESSPIESIELTASGNYIIHFLVSDYIDNPGSRSAKISHKNPFVRKNKTRSIENMLFGDFTKISSNKYNLRDFGTIEILSGNKLRISNSDDYNATYDVVKKETVPSNRLNDRFCRTWYVKQGVFEVFLNGKLQEREVISDPDDVRDEYVKYVVITKAGTFIQVDWENEIESNGIWEWADESKQLFTYKFSDEYEWGIEQVAFYDNYADFTYTETEMYEGQKLEYRETVTVVAR